MEILVHEIFWKQNSPFGTYVANDSIKIYWDDVAESIKVYKNGGLITSGSDIPYLFTYSGNDQNYYKSEEHYYTLICTLALEKVETIRTISGFPYIQSVLLTDHPSCAASPLVCDLLFDSLPSVTNATSSTSNDGEITVSASSSNGLVEYSIGSDFVYGSGQASGAFSGLAPGTYTIYARDAINCFSEISVTVRIQKTYGTKYRLEYSYIYDLSANVARVDIQERDYSGSITEVIADETPFVWILRGEGEVDKFIPILTVESQINLISETNSQFIGLFTGDPDKYRVVFSRNINNEGFETIFTHKLLPNQYTEQYVSPPYISQFSATDGTPELSKIAFTDDIGGRLYGSIDQISVVAFCLRKLGLGLNIRCGINMYATGMDSTATDDPLDQAYVDLESYYINFDNPTCYDVIKAILEPYGARLVQWDNVWNIVRIEELVSDYDYREFDENGVYVSNGNTNPIVNIKSADNFSRMVWENYGQSFALQPGYGKIKVNYNLGLKSNILKNGDFRLKLSNNVIPGTILPVINTDGFQIIKNDSVIELIGYETIEDDNVALQMTTDSAAYIISDVYSIKMLFNDRLRLVIRFKCHAVTREYPYQKIKFRVTYGAYYLYADGTWDTTANEVIYFAKEFGKFSDIQMVLSPPSGALSGLNFQIRVYGSSAIDAEFNTLTNLRAKTTTTAEVSTRTQLKPSSTGGGVTNGYLYYYELENNTSAESVPNIVRPNDYNVTTNPFQWILKKVLLANEPNDLFSIDKIQLEYLPGGNSAPTIHNSEISAESNNPEFLEKDLFHGSLINNIETSYGLVVPAFVNASIGFIVTGSENAEQIYSSILRDSAGNGYTTWSRDNITESRFLHEIFLRTLAGQYSRPWRKMSGALTGDLYISPITCLNEVFDSNKKYIPISIECNDKMNSYSGQFDELLDVTDTTGESGEGGGSGSGLGFTIGFTTGFDA